MDIRERLVTLLSGLHAFQLGDDRQVLVGNLGFDRLRARIKWEGDAQTFADHLVLVLARQGREALVSFIANLEESKMVGLEHRQELGKLSLDIAALNRPRWLKEFVFVAIPKARIAFGVASLLLTLTPAILWGVQVWNAPTVMKGDFNVAIADFGQLDDLGQVHAIDDGRTLSTWLFDGLKTELANKSAGQERAPLDIEMWHDSMILTEKRTQIGLVTGATAEERATKAARLTKSIGADILVYGVLTNGPRPELSVEFYVDPVKDWADEILGTYALANPIPVTLPILDSDDDSKAARELRFRSKILALFTDGLKSELSEAVPRPFAMMRYKEALAEYLWSGQEKEGQEVLHHFIGRQYYALGKYEAQQGKNDDAVAHYHLAYETFQKASKVREDYARPYIGKGHVYFALANQLKDPRDRLRTLCMDLAQDPAVAERMLQRSCLDQAISEYELAVKFASRPGASGASVKAGAHIALGGAYRLKGEAYMHDGQFDAASCYFDTAIEHEKMGLALLEGQEQPVPLALGNYNLATAYREKGHVKEGRGHKDEARLLYEDAKSKCMRCIEHLAKLTEDITDPAVDRMSEKHVEDLGGKCKSLLDELDELLRS